MNKSDRESLSPSEWKVYRIVCELKSCAARNVYQLTGQEFGWAPGTTKTLLRRLVDKGHLKTKQVGNSFLYEPATSLMDSVMNEAETLLDHALDGTAAPFVFHMVKEGKLSANDLDELRNLLDDQTKSNKKRKE